MALPTATELATPADPGSFLSPLNRTRERLVDWSRGGRGIQNPDEGLDVLDWRARCVGRDLYIGAPGAVAEILYYTLPVDPWEIAFSFDTNMNVVVAWEGEDYTTAFRWFDPVAAAFTVVPLPSLTRCVRVQFDDVRPSEYSSFGDTIISYLRGDKLYCRLLRERFQQEHELYSHELMHYIELGQVGMNDRTPPAYQWQLRGAFTRPRPTNPTPMISALEPSSTTAGAGAFTLTIHGSGFVADSVARWAGQARATTFISSTELEVAILAGDVAEPGEASVSVVNPSPGGGVSNAVTFTIEEAPPEPVQVVLDEVGSGQFPVPAGVTSLTHLLIVGGGGGGGSRQGGGGGGGSVQLHTDVPVTPETMIAYTVADGGEGGTGGGRGQQGGTSSFGDLVAGGGGGGGGRTTDTDGGSGANGGGGGGIFPGTSDGGTGTDGHDGGGGAGDQFTGGGGGGGAGEPGEDCDASNSANPAGSGGDGIDLSEIFGTDVGDEGWFGAGGGAGRNSAGSGAAGTGGKGGGGDGSRTGVGEAGAPGTGGGGGGSFTDQDAGGKGGSGIIIIRYLP